MRHLLGILTATLTLAACNSQPTAPEALPTLAMHAVAPVRAGDMVTFRAVLRNTTSRAIHWSSPGYWGFDSIVYDEDGTQLWRYREGAWTLEGHVLDLLPGDSVSYDAKWVSLDRRGQPYAPGTYRVLATIIGSSLAGQPLVSADSAMTFEILPVR